MSDKMQDLIEALGHDAVQYMLETKPENFDWWKESGGTDEELKDFLTSVSGATIFYIIREIAKTSKTNGQIALLLLAGVKE